MAANSSGSSSRKASWPRSVSISTKDTDAPAAFSACTIERLSSVGKQPIAGEGHQAEAGLGAGKGIGQPAAMIGGEVEIVHRPGHVEIGIGVEAVDEGHALVAQIALDLEVGVEAEGERFAVLQIAAELAVQGGFRQIGDVGGHARHRQPLFRALAMLEIFAAMPVRVGHHGLPADLVEGDVLRGMARAGGDRQRREHALRIARRPFQHLHAAHRAAEHAEQFFDAEMVDQHQLCPHHVADGDDRQVEPVGLAGGGIGRGRAGRAQAAADDVGADDEEAVGVDDLAGADQHFPPARLAGHRIGAGDMLVAGQRMADEDGVGAGVVERAVGLVGDLERRQQRAGVELERLVGAETQHRARRLVGLVVGLSSAQSGHRIHLTLWIHASCFSKIDADAVSGRRGQQKTGIAVRKAGYRMQTAL